MFKAMPAGARFEATPEQIVGLQRSINTQAIALAGGPMQKSRAWIVSMYDPSGKYRVYVWLGLIGEGEGTATEGVLFRSDPELVDMASFSEIESEALELVQDQGFNMEALDFFAIEPKERAAMLVELPFRQTFRADRRPAPTQPAQSGPATHAPNAPQAAAPPARNASPPRSVDRTVTSYRSGTHQQLDRTTIHGRPTSGSHGALGGHSAGSGSYQGVGGSAPPVRTPRVPQHRSESAPGTDPYGNDLGSPPPAAAILYSARSGPSAESAPHQRPHTPHGTASAAPLDLGASPADVVQIFGNIFSQF